MKKIVVTGGAGFVGGALLRRLSNKGYELSSIDNYISGREDNHILGVKYINGDAGQINQFINFPVDYVFHFGEYSRVEPSFNQPNFVYNNNIGQFGNILDFCLKHKAKLIYAASSTRYSTETEAIRLTPYTWSKYVNAETLQNYIQWYGLDACSLYFYNVYGEGENQCGPFATVIAKFIDRYRNDLPLEITKPGTQRRNFTYINDLIDAIILVMEEGRCRSYQLGNSIAYTIEEVASMFPNAQITYTPEVLGNREGVSSVDNAELYDLGWRPKQSLPEYIRENT